MLLLRLLMRISLKVQDEVETQEIGTESRWSKRDIGSILRALHLLNPREGGKV